jgi:PKD repeat protein
VINAFTNNDTICQGQSAQLQAQLQGPGFGMQIQWQPGGMSGLNPVVSPVATTTYVVSATSQMTGCTGRDSVVVEVLPAATAGFTYAVNMQTVTYTNTSTNATSWSWDFGDGSGTSNLQDPVYTYSSQNTYTVTLIVSNGNCTDTIVQQVIVGFVGLPQAGNFETMSIFPNPASGTTSIEFDSDRKVVDLEVNNSTGQVISATTLKPFTNGHYKYEMDLNGMPAGIYQVRLRSETETITKMLVVR